MTSLSMILALAAGTAHAEPYVLDFGLVGIGIDSDEADRQQALFDQLNDGAVDVSLSQFAGDDQLDWAQNGVSQITWSTDVAVHDDFPARALRYHLGDGVYECDIAVNTADVTWSSSDDEADGSRYGGWGRTLGTTMMHELGHCLRIGHVSDEYNIMGADFTHVHTNNGTLHFYLGEDAIDRLVDLHDVNTGYEDAGVVHWRYAGNDDGDAYSNHERTVVRSVGSAELPSYLEANDDIPVFLVRAGDTVRPEFTFENNGASNNIDVTVSYRLSTNDWITTSDAWIGDSSFSLGRDDVYTTSREVWIPTWQQPGRYHLGAVVALQGMTDDEPANNATWIDIEVLGAGDPDFCEGPEPCERFQGDCDADSDCAVGLQCIHDQGELYGFDPLVDVCDLPQGDPSYCSVEFPCERGQGDCDTDAHCTGGMTCTNDLGPAYGFASWVDVCDYPVGHAAYCSPEFPCDIGEGDCDTDADCAVGTCHHDVGADYGYSSLTDVCEYGLVLGVTF